MIRVVGLGAGGHAKVVMEILRLAGDREIVGLLDPNRDLWGSEILGIPVLGGDERIAELHGQGVRHAFIGVGSVGESGIRRRIAQRLADKGFEVVSAIHPAAVVSPSAVLGEGVTVMAGAVINACACLGDHVIINTGAIVEHDCVVGTHAHIAPGAVLAGAVEVGADAHVGMGACVRQGIRIGVGAVVGAGAVVVSDIAEGATVAGVPARPLRRGAASDA